MKWFRRTVETVLAMVMPAVLIFVAGHVQGASPPETRDYEAASRDFNIKEWVRAEDAAAKFISKYNSNTNSEYFAKVVLIQAQAQFNQKKYADMAALLTAQLGRAGSLGDQFVYWLAEGYYAGSDYHTSAETFARMVKDYPASPLRAKAAYGEALARSKLKDWARVADELGRPDGVFQQMAKTNLADEWVVRGLLLLGEAHARQANHAAAEAVLQGIPPIKSPRDLEWMRLYLLCDSQMAAGHKEAARQTSVSLIEAAQNKPDLGRSMELQGRILEELDLLPEAANTYDAISQRADLPAEQQRQAFLKSVELTLRSNKTDEAEQKLNDYFSAHPDLDKKGLEALTLGELRLRKYFLAKNGAAAAAGGTNNLTLARTMFEGIISSTNSEYAGKAQLNLGWCLWEEKKYPESLAAFSNAVQQLPFSTDQAVARFKMGDNRFQMTNYAGAEADYNAVVNQFGTLTAVKNELFERALYQLVRTGLEQTNVIAASGAMGRILELFPDGLMGQSSMLLVGQGLSAEGNTTEARRIFLDFASRFQQSPLLPEIKLAIARTYEVTHDWPHALEEYDAWVAAYANNPSLPRGEFARAWVNYQAGRETNAFRLFTNFVTRFPSNELALKAQYWVGDYYWRQQDFVLAEAQYQEVFKNKNWPVSKLQYEALMMAGRAAIVRENYQEAIGYFTNLFKITNCPLDLRLQALFAAGDAKMTSAVTAPATNLSAYTEAMEYYFKPILDASPSNRIAVLAWGRIGDCCLQLAASDPTQFKSAIDAYQNVMNSPLADISARSMAERGLAMTLEARARLKPNGMQLAAGVTEALDHNLNVAVGKNRRGNEVADPYWVKETGKAAGLLDEEWKEWEKAAALYDYLSEAQPAWKSYWNKRGEAARAKAKEVQEKPPQKN